jgi:hypothetical protein
MSDKNVVRKMDSALSIPTEARNSIGLYRPSVIRMEKADLEIIEYWEEQYRNKAIGLIDLIRKEYH